MASSVDALSALKGLRRADLIRFLETDARVREWLAEALLSTAEAADLLGVERPRIWRWEKAEKLLRVASTRATPIFLRVDAEALRDQLVAEAAAEAAAKAAKAAA